LPPARNTVNLQPMQKHVVHGHTFWLSPQRCLFWEQEKALVLSDLHFGKTGHFRKSGIAVPQTIFKEELQRLTEQIVFFKAERLIIVGDMFHSEINKELDLFLRWRNDFSSLNLQLIRGNHDILEKEWYEGADIEMLTHELVLHGFRFVHDGDCEQEGNDEVRYCFSGHIHPGIRISGIGKQSLAFPCFYFGEDSAILPAFSRFTGLAMLHPDENDSVYAIVNQEVMKIG